LALNEVLDGSGEYRDAIYQGTYRAELAKARAQVVEHKLTFSQLVKNRHSTHRNELPSGPHLGTIAIKDGRQAPVLGFAES
jgi:hypothetical protein